MMRTRTLALITLFFAFLMLIVGSLVHNSQEAFVCTSWPLCYGPSQASSYVGVNFAHRGLGLLVGLLTLITSFSAVLSENKKPKLAEVSFLCLFLVGLQGLMGGLSSLYKLPLIVNTSHFVLSLIYLSSLIFLEHRLADRHEINHIKKSAYKSKWYLYLSDGLGLIVFLLFTTIALGSFVRHSGALNACGLGDSSVVMCFSEDRYTLWPRLAPAQIHMFYRLFSFLTAIFGCSWMIHVFRVSEKDSNHRKVTLIIAALLLTFVGSGMGAIASGLMTSWNIIHFASGALAFALSFRFFFSLKEIEKDELGGESISMWSDLLEITKPRLGSLVMATVFVGLMVSPYSIGFFSGLIGFSFTFLLVMGAAAYNCYMEREIDKQMDRTKDRPLPAGRMSAKTAFVFSVGLMAIALAGLFYFSNLVTTVLGFIAAVLYLFAYTPLKQKSVIALYVGAIPGAIPPVMGWTMTSGKMDPMAWALFWILFVWQLPHFLAISIYHAEDYGRAEIKVYPNSFGRDMTKWGILLLTLVLDYVSLYPWLKDLGVSDLFGYFAIFLNILFTLIALRIVFISKIDEEALRRWARIYFLASIFYLPLLLGSMIYLS